MMNNFARGGQAAANLGMMRGYYNGWSAAGPYAAPLHLVLSLITWILIIAILVAVLRWLWKKGGK